MNTSLDDDLRNKNIEINKIDPRPLASKESVQNPAPPQGIKLVKNTYFNLVKNIKNLATKKNTSETSPQNGNVEISSSQNESVDIVAPKTWKDKLAITLISKLEVQKNITVFLSLLGFGSLLLCFSIFLIPFIITSPSKFSLCFAFGCTLVLISFLFYHGTKNYILKLFDKKRFTITVLFICSILLVDV